MPRFPARTLFAILCALAASPAAGDVRIEVVPGDRIAGSISPAGETEAFLVDVAQGWKLDVRVKGKKARGVRAAVTGLRVYTTGSEVAADLPASKKGARFSGTVGSTGVARVEVFGDGVATGDYALSIRVVPPKTVPFEGDLSSGDLGIGIALQRGYVPTVRVRAAAGSSAEPRVLRLDRDGEAVFSFTPEGAGHPSETRRLPVPPVTGDYALYVTNVSPGGAGAGFAGDIRFSPPKPAPKRRTLDIRDATLGSGGAAGGSAEGAVLGTDGGLVEASDLTGLPGASVQIPAGALSFPSAILVGTAPDLDPPGGATGAGPTVFFGPDGQTFASAVIVTIPFDPGVLAGDLSRLVVYVRDAKGAVSLVPPPYTVDAGAGTVSFPTSHFSDYVAAVRRAAPHDLNGDGFDDLVLGAPGHDGGRGGLYVFFGGSNPPAGDIQASRADVALVGEAPGRRIGRAWAVGDFDADGFADLAVSAGETSAPANPEIRIYRGGPSFAKSVRAGTRLTLAASTASGRDPGLSLAAGDVTGDGLADLLVGAPAASGGRVYVVPGGPGISDVSLDGPGIGVFSGNASDGTFGQAVLAADLTGDLVADVIVGAPDVFGFGSPTRTVIYPGGGAVITSPGLIDPKILSGFSTSDGFGEGLAAGDYDGDGDLDLFVGGWRRTEGAVLLGGAVYVFDGPILNDDVAANATLTSIAETSFEIYGRTLALLDTDNLSSTPYPLVLYAGAWGRDTTHGVGSGAVAIVEKGTLLADDPPREYLPGENTDDQFGYVHPPIDWNGDGRLDLIVGAPGAHAGAVQGGAAYVWLGPSRPSSPRLRISGASNGAQLGIR